MAEPVPVEFHRDAGRWRDRLELRLDNRQVFFLFFGSAVVACMLFVLGVMVGKRIESRGQAEAPALTDPLAALDRMRQPPPGVAAPDPELTFPSTLIGGPARAHVAKPATPKAAAPKPVAALPAGKPPAAAPPASKPVPAVARPPAPRPAPPTAAADPAKQAKGKYTLQLSTFFTAAEAEAFARKYPGAFVIEGDLPGKGQAYRVRYGNFASFKEATSAKQTFEKEHNAIALVAVR